LTVWLGRRALEKMRDEAAASHPLETGGVLLGWRSGSDRVVIDLRGPGPHALHGRHRFLPDHAWQVGEIHRAFRDTSGDVDYIGDWHSHPDGVAAMSNEDASTLRHIARRVTDPLMLILAGGTGGGDWSAVCWKGLLHRGLIYRRFEVVAQELRLFDPAAAWPAATGQWGIMHSLNVM
jgi:integrative and conjugative element protein (TIGR02256 family)